jgi:hypothetical protein
MKGICRIVFGESAEDERHLMDGINRQDLTGIAHEAFVFGCQKGQCCKVDIFHILQILGVNKMAQGFAHLLTPRGTAV